MHSSGALTFVLNCFSTLIRAVVESFVVIGRLVAVGRLRPRRRGLGSVVYVIVRYDRARGDLVSIVVQISVSIIVVVVVVIVLRFMRVLGVVRCSDRRVVGRIAAGRSRSVWDLICLVVPVVLLVIRILVVGFVILIVARTSRRGCWAIVRVVPDQVNDIAYN